MALCHLESDYFSFQNVDFEVRAGLSSVYNDPSKGWVADDVHSESASRTLAYACTSLLRLFVLLYKAQSYVKVDDFAAYVLADALKKPNNITTFLYERSMRTPFTLFNSQTNFMEARNEDGSWAGDSQGWTEGDYLLVYLCPSNLIGQAINGPIALTSSMLFPS